MILHRGCLIRIVPWTLSWKEVKWALCWIVLLAALWALVIPNLVTVRTCSLTGATRSQLGSHGALGAGTQFIQESYGQLSHFAFGAIAEHGRQ